MARTLTKRQRELLVAIAVWPCWIRHLSSGLPDGRKVRGLARTLASLKRRMLVRYELPVAGQSKGCHVLTDEGLIAAGLRSHPDVYAHRIVSWARSGTKRDWPKTRGDLAPPTSFEQVRASVRAHFESPDAVAARCLDRIEGALEAAELMETIKARRAQEQGR